MARQVPGVDYRALRRERNLSMVRALLDRLEGVAFRQLRQVDIGPCTDCSANARERWLFGSVSLCRPCARLRLATAAREAEEIGSDEPEPS
jgi:hypothetical protein